LLTTAFSISEHKLTFPVLNANQAPVMPPFMGLIRHEDNIHYSGRNFSSHLLCQFEAA